MVRKLWQQESRFGAFKEGGIAGFAYMDSFPFAHTFAAGR